MSGNKVKKYEEELSIYISYLLRHCPEDAGLTMYDFGWVNVNDLLAGINKAENKYIIDKGLLDKIVANDKKKRYSYNEDETQIKANQGHSVKGILFDFKEATPPEILYHGTALRFMQEIKAVGNILKMNRHAVHLSDNAETAEQVGKRHVNKELFVGDKLVVLEVDTVKMLQDGYKFFISDNGVWLTEKVPLKYVKNINEL